MARPLNRNQQLENAAFLSVLTRTGNARGAARAVDKAYGTMQHRRAHHPAFATRWDVAVASAHARLNRHGPELKAGAVTRVNRVTSDSSATPTAGRPPAVSQVASLPACGSAGAFRTAGGEPVVVRLKSGKLQVRAAQAGKLTRAGEQAFLLALSATANIRLSAAAAGACEKAFYRRRARDPAFAREWRLALAQGYERLEAALLEAADPESHEHDGWRHNEPPALPPMTSAQALQLLYLHQKEARLLAEPAHLKRRRGETWEATSYRLAAMHAAARDRDREAFRVAQAARAAGDAADEDRSPHEPPIVLPDLAQVTGWSRADGAKGGHGPAALFGGWRMADMSPADRARGEEAREQARVRHVPVVRAVTVPRRPGRQLLPGTVARRGGACGSGGPSRE